MNSESRFDLSEGRFYSYRRGRNLNTLVVKSLTNHWSVGAMTRLSRQTFTNQRLNLRIAPGIEYNVFRYDESTNRQLTFQWTAGVIRFKYDQETDLRVARGEPLGSTTPLGALAATAVWHREADWRVRALSGQR